MDYISEKKINEVQNMIREMDIKDYPEFDVDKNIDLLKIFPFYHEATILGE